jgi:molybdopterin-synthase adenylyltransferase
VKPRLKEYGRRVGAGAVSLLVDVGVELTLEDPDGRVRALLDLLDGTRTVEEVVAALRERWTVETAEVEAAIVALAEAGLLEDAAAESRLDPREKERYASNLEFFGTFARLRHTRYAYQERLRESHVALLGVGGLGSTVLLNLAGMGVGRITVVDSDRVELKNLARQFLYREHDIGASKVASAVATARALNSELDISAIERRIDDANDVPPVIAGTSLVISAIDHPAEAQRWVNAACVSAGIPFVAGAFQAARGMYGSVDPGRSGCLECPEAGSEDDRPAPSVLEKKVNRGIGPVATLTGSLMSLEALRYLSRFAPPVAAGKIWIIDFVTGRVDIGAEWRRATACPVCGKDAAAGRRVPVSAEVA